MSVGASDGRVPQNLICTLFRGPDDDSNGPNFSDDYARPSGLIVWRAPCFQTIAAEFISPEKA